MLLLTVSFQFLQCPRWQPRPGPGACRVKTRGESLSRLVGEGARSVMLSLNPMDGERQMDQRTLQDHVVPHSSSDLLISTLLMMPPARSLRVSSRSSLARTRRTPTRKCVTSCSAIRQKQIRCPVWKFKPTMSDAPMAQPRVRSANSFTCRHAAFERPMAGALSSTVSFTLCSKGWNPSLFANTLAGWSAKNSAFRLLEERRSAERSTLNSQRSSLI
jgi:hypothetical protein